MVPRSTRHARRVLAVVALIWSLPTLWVAWEALTSGGLGLHNLQDAWNSAPFGTYIQNTVLIVGGLLVIQLLFGSVAGYAISRRNFRLRGPLTFIFLLQMLVPVSAIIIPEYQVIKGLGLLNTQVGIMLPYVTSGIAVFTFRQAFRSVPMDLEDAARLDGCSAWGALRAIYLPAAAPAALAFSIVSVSFHWTDFFWPLVVTTTDSARPLVVGLAMVAQASESGAQWNLIAAATVIVTAPILLVFAVGSRWILRAFSSVVW